MGAVPDNTAQSNTQFADDAHLAKQYYQIALGLQAANGGVLGPYDGLEEFRDGENGPLLPYDEIAGDRPASALPILGANLSSYIIDSGYTGLGEFIDQMNAGREFAQNATGGQ